MTDESAKAVQEIAKATGKLADSATEFGKWLGGVLGTAPEDFMGLALGDWLHEVRFRNADQLRRNTDKILSRRNVRDDQRRPLNSKYAISFFQAATEESDEMLQDMWARILANELDPNSGVRLRRVFISILSKFEPLDATVLDFLGERMHQHARSAAAARASRDELAAKFGYGIRETMLTMATNHLAQLNCLEFYRAGEDRVQMTALGYELWLSCRKDCDD